MSKPKFMLLSTALSKKLRKIKHVMAVYQCWANLQNYGYIDMLTFQITDTSQKQVYEQVLLIQKSLLNTEIFVIILADNDTDNSQNKVLLEISKQISVEHRLYCNQNIGNTCTDGLLWIPKYQPTDNLTQQVYIPKTNIGIISDHLQVLILKGHINIDPALPSTFEVPRVRVQIRLAVLNKISPKNVMYMYFIFKKIQKCMSMPVNDRIDAFAA